MDGQEPSIKATAHHKSSKRTIRNMHQNDSVKERLLALGTKRERCGVQDRSGENAGQQQSGWTPAVFVSSFRRGLERNGAYVQHVPGAGGQVPNVRARLLIRSPVPQGSLRE
eukprot:1182312-Pleurochrysis_carterae.AAC.1